MADLQAEQARALEAQAAQAASERQAALQALTDRLKAEHRAEVQALRSRWALVRWIGMVWTGGGYMHRRLGW